MAFGSIWLNINKYRSSIEPQAICEVNFTRDFSYDFGHETIFFIGQKKIGER